MKEQVQELVASYHDGHLDRRDFLMWCSILGLAAPLMDATSALAVAPARRSLVPRGGHMKVGAALPTSIDPPTFLDGAGIAIAHQVVEPLVKINNRTGTLIPHLAVSWMPSNSGATWTFHLRQGVKFHNGQLMTADDVVATFKRLVNPKTGSTALSQFGSILKMEGVRKVDQYTVAFHLERPVVDFPYYLRSGYQAVILPANWPGHFAKNPIGTGPFKMVEYIPQQRARYVRNPNYWAKGLPYLDGLDIIIGGSPESQITALLGGSLDTLVRTQSNTVPALKGNPSVKLLTARSSFYDGIFMRTDQPPFNDRRVRQAMALCINRPDVVKSVLLGLGEIGNDHVVAPLFPLFTPIPQRMQDYAQAKELLKAAGHANGLNLSLTTASDVADLAPIAVVAQAMWKQAGINVKIKTEPGPVYYTADWLKQPLTVTDWGHRPTPGQHMNTAYRTTSIWNASHWSNPTFDALVSQSDATLDFTKRKAITKQLELLMNRETPSIISFFYKAPRAMRATVQGVESDPFSFLDLTQAYFSA